MPAPNWTAPALSVPAPTAGSPAAAPMLRVPVVGKIRNLSNASDTVPVPAAPTLTVPPCPIVRVPAPVPPPNPRFIAPLLFQVEPAPRTATAPLPLMLPT
ncbi:hypothetical protein FQZ97_660920 [compost metagenome]